MEIYPKIETLYDRDPDTFKVREGALRRAEFWLPNSWLLTEKIDGMNARVGVTESGAVAIGGRTDNAQLTIAQHAFLTDVGYRAQAHFTRECEGCVAVVFGELYGPKIQKGGGLYRKSLGFRIFDVKVGNWWLNWKDVEAVAESLGVSTVPVLGIMGGWKQAAAYVDELSAVSLLENPPDEAAVPRQEGIVARTDPLLFDRRGDHVMWKLKGKDLAR